MTSKGSALGRRPVTGLSTDCCPADLRPGPCTCRSVGPPSASRSPPRGTRAWNPAIRPPRSANPPRSAGGDDDLPSRALVGVGPEGRRGRAVIQYHRADDADAFRPVVWCVRRLVGSAPRRTKRAGERVHRSLSYHSRDTGGRRRGALPRALHPIRIARINERSADTSRSNEVRAGTLSSMSQPARNEPADDYCVDCGHDHHPNHRGGRCWTDVLGNAIERTPTKIACPCKQFQSAKS